MAVKQCVRDSSAYVRKAAAHAVAKVFALDPEQVYMPVYNTLTHMCACMYTCICVCNQHLFVYSIMHCFVYVYYLLCLCIPISFICTYVYV